MIELRQYQKDAIKKLHTGSILCGGVGTGKTITSLAYYFYKYGGIIFNNKPDPTNINKKLYVITTAKKRDSHDWEMEANNFLLKNIVVDSWNNISKYTKVQDCFIIFDEQRVVGYGAWTKSFLEIAKHNDWILLSATPGDNYIDYMPVLLANGFYKNKTEFKSKHVIYEPFLNFPKIKSYFGTKILDKYINYILVTMEPEIKLERIKINVIVDYDKEIYKHMIKFRWNIEEERPIENASEYCYKLREIVNSDLSRINAIKNLLKTHNKVIIFYNFNYEKKILREYLESYNDFELREYSGELHEDLPTSDKWIYIVNYKAGSEAWNCITTNVIIFYSLNYSYRTMEQAAGRIDRSNSPFKELFYYYIYSRASIDNAIRIALKNKKNFNVKNFASASRSNSGIAASR